MFKQKKLSIFTSLALIFFISTVLSAKPTTEDKNCEQNDDLFFVSDCLSVVGFGCIGFNKDEFNSFVREKSGGNPRLAYQTALWVIALEVAACNLSQLNLFIPTTEGIQENSSREFQVNLVEFMTKYFDIEKVITDNNFKLKQISDDFYSYLAIEGESPEFVHGLYESKMEGWLAKAFEIREYEGIASQSEEEVQQVFLEVYAKHQMEESPVSGNNDKMTFVKDSIPSIVKNTNWHEEYTKGRDEALFSNPLLATEVIVYGDQSPVWIHLLNPRTYDLGLKNRIIETAYRDLANIEINRIKHLVFYKENIWKKIIRIKPFRDILAAWLDEEFRASEEEMLKELGIEATPVQITYRPDDCNHRILGEDS